MAEGKKISVLVADDEQHIRTLIKTIMMTMNALIVAEAKNGEEAVELFREKRPDILMLDINMPIKDGTTALEEILTDFPEAFVIMMTSVSDLQIVEKCIKLGALSYIRKDTPLPAMKQMIKDAWKFYRTQKGEDHE